MKSSLTLVSSSENAVQNDTNLAKDEEIGGSDDDKKPHLRLVGPENQADFVKEAVATKPKRKPRKRKSDAEAPAARKPSKAVEKTEAEKKPPKTTTRKAKVAEKSTSVLHPQNSSPEHLSAIKGLISTLAQIADMKADLLIVEVIQGLGEDAPQPLSEDFQGPADPRITESFASAIEDVLTSLADLPAQPAQEIPNITPFRAIGQMFVSKENDPFGATEWTLFEENFTSRWYDTGKEAMEGLHALLVDAGLNFACEAKLISRYFKLDDYVYKRYCFTAVVGIYADFQESDDQERSDRQDCHLNHVVIPEAQALIERIQSAHRADRKKQMKPDNIQLYDKCLKWLAVACGASLFIGVANVAVQTGFFG